MAKGRPSKPGGEGTLVRIDPDIVSKARYLAAARNVAMSELLSRILRPEIDRMFRDAGREMLEGGGSIPAPKRKPKSRPK